VKPFIFYSPFTPAVRISALVVSILLSLTGSGGTGGPSSPSTGSASRSRSEQLAVYFHRPAVDISTLRDQGFGYGEITKILVIAQMSGRPLPELVARNHEGYGWGTISREVGLDPVQVRQKVASVRKEFHIHVHPVTP